MIAAVIVTRLLQVQAVAVVRVAAAVRVAVAAVTAVVLARQTRTQMHLKCPKILPRKDLCG